MNSPKPARRKSKVCYKEKSFTEEINFNIPTKTYARNTPKKSIVNKQVISDPESITQRDDIKNVVGTSNEESVYNRSSRRKSIVCYKEEDSFIGEFNTPTKSTKKNEGGNRNSSDSDSTVQFNEEGNRNSSDSDSTVQYRKNRKSQCDMSDDSSVSSIASTTKELELFKNVADAKFNTPPRNLSRTSSRFTPRQSLLINRPLYKDLSDSESETQERKSPVIPDNKNVSSTLIDIREAPVWNPSVVLDEMKIDNKTNEVRKFQKKPPTDKSSIRRGTRMRQKTALAKEAEEANKSTKKIPDNFEDSESDSMNSEKCEIEKPSALFTEEDVEGKDLFKFKMMHRKQDMVKKAFESVLDSPKMNPKSDEMCKTPRTPKSSQKGAKGTPSRGGRKSVVFTTPKSTITSKAPEKTPHHIRNKIKKKLETMALEDSERTDTEDSGSEFEASDEDQSSEDITGSENESKSDASDSDYEVSSKVKSKLLVSQQKASVKPSSLRKVRGGRDSNYIVKSDDYFSMHGSKKVVTSNHTLERLKTPRLTEDKLQNILKHQKLSDEHRTAIKEIIEDHQKLFDKWMFILSEGYTILLHGVGSKLKLITDFQIQKLASYPCIVINGFFPSLTLKDILESIISDLLEISAVPSSVYDAVKVIETEMEASPKTNLFLLIHNIDGVMLRNNKTQNVLSKLAKIRNIHMIVSADYINAPLIWDHSIISNFNFSWWDVTTLLPYTQETAFESSLMVHNSGALALSSLKNVFLSLTTNARGIFMIIVNHQLKNKKTPHYQGISFKDLYWSAREGFLVSSDLALRAQLTEFLDHKLVKTKRTADGIENLVIPIDNALLQQFAEQNE